MSDFSNPESSASVSFRPNGIYYGIVTNVDEEISRVWVLVPRISVEVEYGPLAVSSLVLPREGERVACVFVENRADSLVVLGVVRNSTSFTFAPPVVCTSTTRPDAGDIPAGTTIFETDTFLTYVWTGTTFGGVKSGGDFSAAGTFINSFGVGVGVVSPRMPFYVSRSHLPISLAGATSGQAVFGLTSGANVALGSSTGSVATEVVDTIQARVGSAAGVLKINPLGGAVQFGTTVAVSAGSFSGNLNATQLNVGTVPAGRLAGEYTGITRVGASLAQLTLISGLTTLNAGGGGLTINGNVQVNGAFNPTAMSANQLTSGKLPYERLTGQVYSTLQVTATNAIDTPNLLNYNGPVNIIPNNNYGTSASTGRALVITNGIFGSATQGGQGHYLKGRLSLASSPGERCGLWFARDDNASYSHFLGRRDQNDGIRLYNTVTETSQIEFWDNGYTFLGGFPPGGAGAQAGTISETGGIYGYSAYGVLIAQGSRREFKNNISPIADPWEIIDAIRPRYYTAKPPSGASQLVSDLHAISPYYGFIVEELMEDAPSLVTYMANEEFPDDITGWDPEYYHGDHITALTVAAVQDLKAQITALEARIESLEA
jgi:hypothetical protein